jgi:hypothetical protein
VSCTRPWRTIVSGRFSSGFQNVTSLIQQASLSTRSLKPKASNISMVRQAMPSACPSCSGPSFCSTMQVRMSENAAICADSVRPAGPQPTISRSTSAGAVSAWGVARGSIGAIRGSPGLKPSR